MEFPSKFPWGYRITSSDTFYVIEEAAIACASPQKTREDNLAAVGFPWRDRPKVIEMLKRQEANARLIGGHRRVGRNVVVHHIIADGTRDERMLALLRSKKWTQDGLMSALSTAAAGPE